MIRALWFLGVMFLFWGCAEMGNENQVDDEALVIDYLATNNIDAYHYAEGLYFKLTKLGTQKRYPNPQAIVTVKYTGYLADGTIFDSSNGKFITIPLANCIEGWKLGIPLFTKGSCGHIFIPPSLGYNGFELPNVPANSLLIYDIELKDFINQ
jgi:FKBP-type peptidyl-prolyl cis-trans isomerase FkpA